MFSRLLLAAALFAPQASSWIHALETARAEADHPICTAGASAHLEPASDHAHHDEGDCSQVPRPSQAALPSSGALAPLAPSRLPPLRSAAFTPTSADPAASPRAPPIILSV